MIRLFNLTFDLEKYLTETKCKWKVIFLDSRSHGIKNKLKFLFHSIIVLGKLDNATTSRGEESTDLTMFD